MAPAEQKCFSALAKAIKHIPDAAKPLNTNDLTRHSIALVEALSPLIDKSVTSPQTPLVAQTLPPLATQRNATAHHT